MDEKTHIKLCERHEELKKLGKVLEAVDASGLSNQTYTRAMNGDKTVRAKTLATILKAQQQTLDRTRKELLTA